MGSRISILLMTSSLVILRMLYKKLNYARISIDSHLWSNGGQTQRWRHHWQLFRVFIISTDSVLLWVCTVIDHRRRENAAALCTLALFDVIRDLLANRRTTIWNLFFAVFTIKIETPFFFYEIQSKGNIGKRNRINWFIFRFGKILRNLSLKSCTQDEKFEVFPFLIYDAWNAVLSICEAWIFLNFVRETGSPLAILLPYLHEIISFFTLRLKIFLRKGEFLL